MSFYSSITDAYDEIFPLNKLQVGFIEDVYPVLSGKKVLDAGCGTGSLAIELGRRGAAVEAFDLDKDMIEKAKSKCPQALNVRFSQNDLLKFNNSYKRESFDVVYCFGNTLVHLVDKRGVKLFLQSVKSVLKPNGTLLLQVVNYDRIMDGKITQLPSIESDHFIFERNYSFPKEDVILFSTILKNKTNDQVFEQSVQLFPIKKIDLFKEILASGFLDVNFLGNFEKEPWTSDSFHTVIKANVCGR